jgi:hypothetical protein
MLAVTATIIMTVAAVAASAVQFSEKKKANRRMRKAAITQANAEKLQVANQAGRAIRQESEARLLGKIQQAKDRGVAHSMLNRSDVQVAALVREADRGAQLKLTASDVKVSAIRGDVRDAWTNIHMNLANRFSQIVEPSPAALALSITGTIAKGVSSGVSAYSGAGGGGSMPSFDSLDDRYNAGYSPKG